MINDDNEFARYLASYLVQNSDDFIDCCPNWQILEEPLYELIKNFLEKLP